LILAQQRRFRGRRRAAPRGAFTDTAKLAVAVFLEYVKVTGPQRQQQKRRRETEDFFTRTH